MFAQETGIFVLIFSVGSLHNVLGFPSPTRPFQHNISLTPADERVHLFWERDGEHMTFEVHARTLGYVGFGWSSTGGMKNGDVMIGWVKDGVARIQDRYSEDKGLPRLDMQQDWELLGGRETDTSTVLTFRRKINTCDEEDLPLEEGTTRLIWSMGSEDPEDGGEPAYHGHVNRGTLSVFLLTPRTTYRRPLPPDSFGMDFTLRNVTVPNKDTTYWCRMIKIPSLETKHHVVMFEPLIQEGHMGLVHHMILYACYHPIGDHLHGHSYECFGRYMPPEASNCMTFWMGWAVGGGPVYLPEHVGIPLGTEDSPGWIRLEVHYDNPGLVEGLVDSSGMRFWATPSLREIDGATLWTGVAVNDLHVIPQRSDAFVSKGYCTGECIASAMGNQTELKIIGGVLHSHLLGRKMALRHVRNGRELPPILKENHYDFNLQDFTILKDEVTLLPGDDLIVECFYDSTDRSAATVGGLPSTSEMCVSFVMYYPAIKLSFCNSLPTPEASLSYIGAEMELRDRRFRVVRPEAYQGMTVREVVSATQWTNETREHFQRSVTEGEFVTFCTRNELAYPPNLKVRNVTEITKPYVEVDVCENKETSGASRGPLTIVLMVTAFILHCGIN